MTVQVELWQLVTLLLSFLGFLFAAGKLLLSQIDRRLSERFSAMEKAREEGGKHWDERFTALQDQARRDSDRMGELERTVLKFQGELPMHYVRREDYIRGQSVIEAKLDGLATKIEAAQLRGLLQGGRNVS